MKIKIKHKAPVVAAGTIEISAPPERVWEVMTDIENWPRWNPDIRKTSVKGPLEEGTEFTWESGPGTISSTLQAVEPEKLLAWTGKTLGIRAIHIWWLKPVNRGTEVRTEESWEGWPARLFKKSMKRTLEKAIYSGLESLKKESERKS
jgi:hypothetical protein